MASCPKCGSYSIGGPVYVKRDYGGECLRYTCMTCGYQEDRACNDAKKD
jgi:hypothetical protein